MACSRCFLSEPAGSLAITPRPGHAKAIQGISNGVAADTYILFSHDVGAARPGLSPRMPKDVLGDEGLLGLERSRLLLTLRPSGRR